jgi:hypothetical protein
MVARWPGRGRTRFAKSVDYTESTRAHRMSFGSLVEGVEIDAADWWKRVPDGHCIVPPTFSHTASSRGDQRTPRGSTPVRRIAPDVLNFTSIPEVKMFRRSASFRFTVSFLRLSRQSLLFRAQWIKPRIFVRLVRIKCLRRFMSRLSWFKTCTHDHVPVFLKIGKFPRNTNIEVDAFLVRLLRRHFL